MEQILHVSQPTGDVIAMETGQLYGRNMICKDKKRKDRAGTVLLEARQRKLTILPTKSGLAGAGTRAIIKVKGRTVIT